MGAWISNLGLGLVIWGLDKNSGSWIRNSRPWITILSPNSDLQSSVLTISSRAQILDLKVAFVLLSHARIFGLKSLIL